jgi:GT2 family glycosyltransferase
LTYHLKVAAVDVRGLSGAISAVVVNFNAGGYLAAAVTSVLAQAPPVGEVIVVDNQSSDTSVARLRETCTDPRLRIIALDTNRGFAAACNIGIKATRSPYVLLLNPDCFMFAGALAALTAALDAHANAAAVGPLLVNTDGSEQRGGRRDVPSPWQIFCYVVGLHRLMPRHPRFRSFNRMTDPLPAGPAAVQAISGAAMLIRRAALDVIGGFDERYFMHFEDLDWCLRATQAGHDILFVPGAVVEHTQGVCSASRPLRVEYYKHRSLAAFLSKNFSHFYPRPFMAAVWALIHVHLVWQIARRLAAGTGRVPAPRAAASPRSA